MNKLAVLAFSLLLFFSTMLWYLANGSLNDYLRSQVIVQSHYYSGQESNLLSAEFSEADGTTHFEQFSLNNISGSSQPLLLSIDSITAQLAPVPLSQLDGPSIQKRTTTIVHIETLTLRNLHIWSEVISDIGTEKKSQIPQTNIDLLLNAINTQLATDYPALYPEISAAMYAKSHPDRNAEIALQAIEKEKNTVKVEESVTEINTAIIASNEAKQKKRLLGKAETRIIISSVIIENVTLTTTVAGKIKNIHIKHLPLDAISNENGLASNQIGGELLRRLLEAIKQVDNQN